MEPRKLTMEQAHAIRNAYENGCNQRWLAERFGVCKGTIKNIVQNKTYKVYSK